MTFPRRFEEREEKPATDTTKVSKTSRKRRPDCDSSDERIFQPLAKSMRSYFRERIEPMGTWIESRSDIYSNDQNANCLDEFEENSCMETDFFMDSIGEGTTDIGHDEGGEET